MENARNAHTFGVSFILSPNLSPKEKKEWGQENKIPYGFFPRGDKFGDKFLQTPVNQRFPAFSICPRFLICPQNRGQMKIPFPVFREDKRPETVDLQGFDGFCPRVDTENMGTDKNENFVPIFSFCPRLSPKQENRGQNGPFENARKMGLF